MKNPASQLPLIIEIDGEQYRLCPMCHRKGYGADAYHPDAPEFWTPWPRNHWCTACSGERSSGRRIGIMPGDFKPTQRTSPYGRCNESLLSVHAEIAV